MQVEQQASIERIAQQWQETPQSTLKDMIEKYGQPHEFSDSQATWFNVGPWKRTILTNDPTRHEWPELHMDCLEQIIDFQVPLDKYDALAQYDGSVTARRTQGELSARCAGEAMNFNAINLAYDIITDKRSVEDARAEYVRVYNAYQNDEKPAITQRFLFELPTGETADPDVAAN